MDNKMPDLISSKCDTESHSNKAALPVPRIRHWMVGVAVSVGAIAAGAPVAFTFTPTAHADGDIPGTIGDIPGTGIAVPTTPADIVSVGQTLLTQLHTDAREAATTGYTNYLQDEAITAGSFTWLGAEATNIQLYNDDQINPHYYLYAGQTGPIMTAETQFLAQIVNSFEGLTLPKGYDNSTLASAFNHDVVYETDINSAIIGNSNEADDFVSKGILVNVQDSQLAPLITDTASMLGFDSDLYHEAVWTVDVAALASLF
jgi:hypothetical protein